MVVAFSGMAGQDRGSIPRSSTMGLGPKISSCMYTAGCEHHHDITPQYGPIIVSKCVHQSPYGVRSCKLNPCEYERVPPLGNPVPTNFIITGVHQRHKHTIVIVTYPDANNYEGKKILFFKDTKEDVFKDIRELDPHFCDDDHLSPFARFEPTPEGYSAALRLAEVLQ